MVRDWQIALWQIHKDLLETDSVERLLLHLINSQHFALLLVIVQLMFLLPNLFPNTSLSQIHLMLLELPPLPLELNWTFELKPTYQLKQMYELCSSDSESGAGSHYRDEEGSVQALSMIACLMKRRGFVEWISMHHDNLQDALNRDSSALTDLRGNSLQHHH